MEKVKEIIKKYNLKDCNEVLNYLKDNYNGTVLDFSKVYNLSLVNAKAIKEKYTRELNKTISDEEFIKFINLGISTTNISKELKLPIQSVQRRVKKLYESNKLDEKISIPYRPNTSELSDIEYDVLIGGLLGDSWVGKLSEKSKNCMGSFTHKIEHTEYVYYKYSLLKRLCAEPKIHNKLDKRSNRNYQQCFCKIRTNPILNPIRDLIYDENGQKHLKEEVILKLSPLGIAIFYMDDGTKTSSGYSIRMDAFLKEEWKVIKKLFKKFNIIVNLQYNSSVCYIPSKEKEKFKTLIIDYVPNCMKYKL